MKASFDASSPCVMLVRVDPDDEVRKLGLSGATARVLRVRHPLPARERIHVTRPWVVVVGAAVPDRDAELLAEAAREIDAELVEMGLFVATAALREALRRALARAKSRRQPSVSEDLPDAKRFSRSTG